MKSLIEYIRESKEARFADIIVTTKEGTILLLQRAGYIRRYGGKYALPGGTIDKGEDSKVTAIRELKEESGLVAEEQHTTLWKTYTYSSGDKTDIYVWHSNKPQFELESNIKLSKEHRRYKFISDISEIKETGWAGEQKDILQRYIEKNKEVS